MTDHIDDGGHAFPVSGSYLPDLQMAQVPQCGMTLRDYFAAKALQGDLAASSSDCHAC